MFGNLILSRDIGIDLGTATVVVYVQDKGIVISEPSVVAIDKTVDRVIKVGKEAQEMLGRTPDNIVALRPLKDGSINQYEVTLKMLQYFIRRACGKTVLSPRIMISVPTDMSEVEERAILDAAAEAGARRTFLVEEPIAAALGAGLNIDTSIGNMVVNIGGGVTETAVISLGGIVVSKCIKIGGDQFDAAIVQYVKDTYNVLIGDRTAESIKIRIGDVFNQKEIRAVEVKGRDLSEGMPKVIKLYSNEMLGAMYSPITAIIDSICDVIERTPPELVGDILHNGIVLVGGGSMLTGLDKLIEKVTGIHTYVAKNPGACVAIGTGKKLARMNKVSDGNLNFPKKAKKDRRAQ